MNKQKKLIIIFIVSILISLIHILPLSTTTAYFTSKRIVSNIVIVDIQYEQSEDSDEETIEEVTDESHNP